MVVQVPLRIEKPDALVKDSLPGGQQLRAELEGVQDGIRPQPKEDVNMLFTMFFPMCLCQRTHDQHEHFTITVASDCVVLLAESKSTDGHPLCDKEFYGSIPAAALANHGPV